MKRIIFGLLLIISFLSCRGKEEATSGLPQLSLSQLNYSVGKNPVKIRLTAQQSPKTDLQIAYRLSGSAVEGTDFTVSDKTFVLKAGATEAVLIVTPAEGLKDQKSLQIALSGQAPSGYEYGLKDYSQLRFVGEKGFLYSFAQSEGELGYIGNYDIRIENMQGGRYRAPEKMDVAIEVDPSSTAVLGEHFAFEGGAKATVPRNRNMGSFQIKFLKKEAGKDKIVLRFAERDGFADGQYGQLSLNVVGPTSFAGNWKLTKIANAKWLEDPNTGYDIKVNELMNIVPTDRIELSGGPYDYSFTPHLSGMLATYFSSATTAKLVGVRSEVLQEESSSPKVDLTLLEFASVNSSFSASTTNIRSAKVGFRLIEVDGKKTLECTIYEFVPIAPSWKNIYDNFGNMNDAPLRLYFEALP